MKNKRLDELTERAETLALSFEDLLLNSDGAICRIVDGEAREVFAHELITDYGRLHGLAMSLYMKLRSEPRASRPGGSAPTGDDNGAGADD